MSQIQAMQAKLYAFNQAREWQRFHLPKNLASCIAIEAAELMEQFLWKEPSEPIEAEQRKAIEHEAADILIALLNFAQVMGIDLAEVFEEKLAINASKYPVALAKGSCKKYNQL